MSDNLFTRHPKEVGESYGEHFAMASWYGLRLIGGGLACFVHAVFPFWFERRGSDTIKALHSKLTRRADGPNWERHPII
jgi:hypothetical protein